MTTGVTGGFAELLNDLEALQKSQTVGDDGEGDKKIQGAAEEGEGAGEGAGEGEGGEGAGEGEGGEAMGKSMTVMVNGEEVEAIDGTELVKSLQEQLGAIQAERATEHEQLSKSLGLMTAMLQEQGNVIKSLQDQMQKLSGEGRGRKSVSGVDGDLAKSLQNEGQQSVALNRDQVLAKCENLFSAGKLTAMDLSIAESSLNRGAALPHHIQTALAAS